MYRCNCKTDSTRMVITQTNTHVIKYKACNSCNAPVEFEKGQPKIEHLQSFTQEERDAISQVHSEYKARAKDDRWARGKTEEELKEMDVRDMSRNQYSDLLHVSRTH